MLGLLAIFNKTHNLDLQIFEEDNRMYYKCYGVIQMSSRTINVRLPETLYKQIEDLAKATARTKSFLAIEALTNYVQSESWQINDIRQGLDEADSGDFASPKEVEAVFLKYGA